MKTILVPTDFKEISLNALNVAVDIARKSGAKIKLLKMIDFTNLALATPEYGLYYANSSIYNTEIKDAKDQFAKIIKQYPDVKIKPVLKRDSPNLTSAVLSEKADLIVMGSEGANGWKELFTGSHTQFVVRYAHCPVLVVKGNVKNFSLRRVLYALDFTNVAFIKKALSVLNSPTTENHFLYVDDGMKFIEANDLNEKMAALAKDFKIDNYKFKIYSAATIEKGILEYAHEVKPDIVIMYTHGHSGIRRVFENSVAEDVVNHADMPIMTVLA